MHDLLQETLTRKDKSKLSALLGKDEDENLKTPNTFTHTPTSAADYEEQLSYSQIKRKRRYESLKRI